MTKCVSCNIEKPKTEFPKFSRKVPLTGECKVCRERSKHIKRRYGINIKEYNELLELQGGKCKICNTDKPGRATDKFFTIDHCHKTLKVRGLLCHKCNTALGLFDDDIERIEIAINYLKGNTHD